MSKLRAIVRAIDSPVGLFVLSLLLVSSGVAMLSIPCALITAGAILLGLQFMERLKS